MNNRHYCMYITLRNSSLPFPGHFRWFYEESPSFGIIGHAKFMHQISFVSAPIQGFLFLEIWRNFSFSLERCQVEVVPGCGKFYSLLIWIPWAQLHDRGLSLVIKFLMRKMFAAMHCIKLIRPRIVQQVNTILRRFQPVWFVILLCGIYTVSRW